MSKMTDSMDQWLRSFVSGQKWLNTIQSPKTKDIYMKNMKQYCTAVGKNPDELIAYKIEGIRNITTMEFQAEDLLDNYLTNAKDLSVHTKVSILSAVKSFYKANRRKRSRRRSPFNS